MGAHLQMLTYCEGRGPNTDEDKEEGVLVDTKLVMMVMMESKTVESEDELG